MAMTDIHSWSSICIDVGRAGYDIIEAADVKFTEAGFADEKALTIALLGRTLSHLKGVILLLEERRIVEARALTRCCVENAFWVAGLREQGNEFAEKMLADEAKRKTSQTQYLFENHPELDPAIQVRLRTWLQQNENARRGRMLNPKAVSELSDDFGRLYLFYSQLSSDSGHPSMTALSRYAIRSADGQFDGIDIEPAVSDEEIDSTYQIVCSTVLTTLMGSIEILKKGAELQGFAILAATLRAQAVAQRFLTLAGGTAETTGTAS
ncbi:DUF5677 domain-containing protein [Bradyrhizobium sp. AS23.2]|uniref:DUF5677 domain-containing protein n=1 Tax=Bradyrhizobium sp. AS23.2 TaxID=1680155 RepID=UPI00093FC92F|nr:DUF5677 domain-containing protein [Bradyrhizobium sp. AS23.2]OKO86173.1 hypothetical protein AC630_03825 [Bradyrhizobium sp. AS23.2]